MDSEKKPTEGFDSMFKLPLIPILQKHQNSILKKKEKMRNIMQRAIIKGKLENQLE